MKILEYIPKYDDKERFDLIIAEIDGKVKTFRTWNESKDYPY